MLQRCLVSPDLFHVQYFVDERRNCRWNFKAMSQLNRDCCYWFSNNFFITLWHVTGDVMSLLCFRICAMKSGSRCTTRRWFIWRTPGAMDGGIRLSWEGQWREAAHRTWEKFTPIHRGPHMFGVAMIVNHENFEVFNPLFTISKSTCLLYALLFWGEKWSFMTHPWWGPNDFWQVESMKDRRRDWWRTPENPKESGQICQHWCDSPMNFQQKNSAFCQPLSTFISFLAKITEGM